MHKDYYYSDLYVPIRYRKNLYSSAFNYAYCNFLCLFNESINEFVYLINPEYNELENKDLIS